MADPDMAQLIAGANAAVAAVDSDTAFNAEMADIDLAVVDEEDEEDLGAQLLELNKDKDKNISMSPRRRRVRKVRGRSSRRGREGSGGGRRRRGRVNSGIRSIGTRRESKSHRCSSRRANRLNWKHRIAADDDRRRFRYCYPRSPSGGWRKGCAP